MKKPGNVCDYKEERNGELYSRFLEVLRSGKNVPLAEMFRLAAKMPSSRFWVSERRAAEVVSMILRGVGHLILAKMHPQRRAMFEELARRVRAKMSKCPLMKLAHATAEAVNEPAPEFYLTEKTAKQLIYAHRRRLKALRTLKGKIVPKGGEEKVADEPQTDTDTAKDEQ